MFACEKGRETSKTAMAGAGDWLRRATEPGENPADGLNAASRIFHKRATLETDARGDDKASVSVSFHMA